MLNKPLQTINIHANSELEPHLDAWRRLAAGRPMRSPEWLLGWWGIYAEPEDELRIILVMDPEAGLVGLAPLYLQNGGGLATLRVLGARDTCTHHTDWLAAAEWEARVGEGVAQALTESQQSWKRLRFEAVDADALAIHTTMKHLTKHGCLGHQRQINSCWRISLPDNWDAYLQTLSRSLRKRCRQLQRQFLDSGRIQLMQVDNAAELQRGYEILLQLHSARWGKTEAPAGVFSDEKFRQFHQEVAGYLLNQNQLRLAWLECDGKPIAIEYQFFDSETVYAYQAGIDLAMNKYSPGKLTMMAAIQFAIARGCQSFDLLGGDEPYKANWRAEPVTCHDLRVWQDRGTARLEWALWNGYTSLAQSLKQIVPARVITRGLRLAQKIKAPFAKLRR